MEQKPNELIFPALTNRYLGVSFVLQPAFFSERASLVFIPTTTLDGEHSLKK